MNAIKKQAALTATFLGIAALSLAVPAFSEDSVIQFTNGEGQSVGHATLKETKEGVIINTEMSNLPQGWHGFHIHAVGACTPPEFSSAGGHFNPQQKEHGYENPKGKHVGDLPNVYVGADGKLNTEVFAAGVSLGNTAENGLKDKDGSALVVHEGKDDYSSDPAGNAGKRLACGVIK